MSTAKASSKNGNHRNAPIWEQNEGPELDKFLTKTLQEASVEANCQAAPETLQVWYKHVMTAVKTLSLVEQPVSIKKDEDDEDGPDNNERPSKRRRRTKRLVLQDPYHVWWISKYIEKPKESDEEEDDDDDDDLPTSMGGRLAQLSPGAWLNALAGVLEGLVHKAHPSRAMVQAAAKTGAAVLVMPTQYQQQGTTVDAYVLNLWDTAVHVHRLVQTAVREDIWRTTPKRIQERMAPELTDQEFAAIRRRIFDTVVLGRGLHANDELDEEDNAPTGPTSTVHDIEKNKMCNNCGNVDQSAFALDRKNGDIICSNCGVVVSESLMHEGSAYRKFEGEADRNHHGDAHNPHLSNAYNLSTTIAGLAPGSGIDGYRGGRGSLETILRNTHAYTELNLSQFGRTDRRTRVGYKDRQKKGAFIEMTHTGDALHLHEAVVQRAKELFSGFRDDRELVQQYKGVLAACLCEAFEQLAKEDSAKGHLVKGVGGSDLTQPDPADNNTADDGNDKPISARAARRNELHHANLAGKGGLLLDFSSVETSSAPSETGGNMESVVKPAASWGLEDCRSWLLEASRRIAQQWVNERRQAVNKEAAQKLPSGPLEELEGQLVEHSITLCEHLEQELQSHNDKSAGRNKNRVVTPRVKDLSKLAIQWQHANGSKQAQQTGRTAGQILLRMTATKLGSILKDRLAGEAIHRELRAVIGRQEAQKHKKMREEASRQRRQQMKRKPWLQARAQS